ncbi:hypothetical protein CK807_11535 [Brucella abortus]|nr:hypothetical protein CK807_11535 [Brucella abortus]RYC05606.1 hypothetical protein EVD17_16890 [Brucella abortus]
MREACAKVAMRMRCGLPDRMSGRMSGKKKNGRGIHSAPSSPPEVSKPIWPGWILPPLFA